MTLKEQPDNTLLDERDRLRLKVEQLETELGSNKEHLRYLESHYKELVENAGIAILTDDESGNLRYFNKRFFELFGYSEDEMKGKSIASIVHPDSIEKVKQYHKQRVEGKEAPSRYEFQGIRKDGSTMCLEVDVVELVERDAIVGTRSYLWDITERRNAEEALKKSESQYRILIEQASDGMIIADLKGSCVDANTKGCSMLGYDRDEILGMSIKTLVPEEDIKENREHFNIIAGGENVVREYKLKRKDGEVFPAEVSAKMLPDKRLLGIIRDITMRKRMEEEVLKAQKLDSIGVLAGGIAHDFNNIITGVLGNISLAKLHIRPGSRGYRKILLAEQSTIRAQDLVNQFITFSKGGKPIKKREFIQEFLEETIHFALSGSPVKCTYKLPKKLMPVEIDAGQVRQVFNNIVINARDVMPKGGILEVKAENVSVEAVKGIPLQPGDYARISFKDHGPGIPDEYLLRIFDPYFSTHDKQRGMGLTAAYSIMKNHGGYIRVETREGTGTIFHVYLPGHSEEKLQPEPVRRKPEVSQPRILLMDDEEVIREVAGEMLEMSGYQVVFAREGSEAIELYQSQMEGDSPFDAVVMDLTIPGGMGGQECMEVLLKIDPNVKAVVSSGYCDDPIMADHRKYGFSGVVKKPYKIDDLKQCLRKIIHHG
ncbi:MAG: PAS domain S-box protein [bacterium]|nr:PAS domain S-box protein [bacterium]